MTSCRALAAAADNTSDRGLVSQKKFWRKFSDAAARLRDVSTQAQESNLLALQAAAFERTFFKKVVFSLATDAINAYINM